MTSRLPYPYPSNPGVTAVMRGNRSNGTKPEVIVRSILHQRGYRFRKSLSIKVGNVRVRPDIVFPRHRVAVFLDGCFWHCCPEHGHLPQANVAYWVPKFDRNARRDRLVNEALSDDGWTVVRIWEHVPPEQAADVIAASLAENQAARSTT